jgi:DNA-binding SARP family transcriptional activator/DNA-binding beta-propeller fold protein YncE
VEFRILGPVEVVSDGRVVALGSLKQRALLALLLLHVNEVVSRERLTEDLWAERAPETAAASLHTYVSQLRKLLEARNGEPRVLLTRAPGYLLALDPDQLDLTRFERLAREGKHELAVNDAQAAAGILAEALSLWRGPPLAEFGSTPFALAESLRLQELRVSALEDRIDADLVLARHQGLIAELEALAREHPFRERLHGQLMLALYRSGRQTEALDVYRQTRRRLVDELGIEPGPALQDLEQSILRHEPALAVEAPPSVAEPEQEHADRATPSCEPASPRTRRLPRRWRLVAAVAILVAITIGVGYAVGGGTPVAKLLAPNSVGFLDANSGRITKSYPVGREPRGITVADNAVWVANYQDSTVTRIDRATGHSVTVAVGGHPTGITSYRGTIWVWTLERLLVPIDPRYDSAGKPISFTHEFIGQRSASGEITAGGGYLWIAAPLTTVIRVDAANTLNRKLIHPDDGVQGAIVYQDGRAWVAGSDQVFPIAAETGLPGSGAMVGQVRDIAFAAGSLWVVSGSPEQVGGIVQALRRVDPHTLLTQAQIGVGADPVAVAAAGGSIWVAARSDGVIEQVAPAQNRVVKTIAVGGKPTAFTTDGEGIWVAGL